MGRFARRVKAWATTNGVPVIYCKAGECKHLIADEHLAAHPPSRPGVFLAGPIGDDDRAGMVPRQ